MKKTKLVKKIIKNKKERRINNYNKYYNRLNKFQLMLNFFRT